MDASQSLTTSGAISGSYGLTLATGAGATLTMQTGVISTITSLTKTGAGTAELSAVNTFTSAVAVNAGVLRAKTSTAALGTNAATCTVADGAALELDTVNGLVKPLSIRGSGIVGAGALRSVNGANVISSTIALAANTTVAVDAGSLQFSGIVSGTGMKLTVKNAATIPLLLNAANTWDGGTEVESGILRLASANRIPNTGTVTVAAGAVLDLNGFADTIGNLAGAGVVKWKSDAAADTLTLGDANDTEFSGQLGDAAGQADAADILAKTGAGTLTLSGDNQHFPGQITIASPGTVKVKHNSALGSTGVSPANTTVASGASLVIDGSLGAITCGEAIQINGIGAGGLGVLQSIGGANLLTGDVTLAAASTVAVSADSLRLDGQISSGANNYKLTVANGAGSALLLGGTTANGTGGIDLNGGILRLMAADRIVDTGTLTIAAGVMLDLNGFAESVNGLAGSGLVRWGSGGTNLFTVGVGNAGTTFSGRLCDGTDQPAAGCSFVKAGTGTLVLSGDNADYPGTMTVNGGGILDVQHANALGPAGGGTTVEAGSCLQLTAGAGSFDLGAEPLTLGGTGVTTNGALRNVSGTNLVGGSVTLTADTTIETNAGTTLTLSGQVTGPWALGKSKAALTGTLVLSGANGYTGVTTVGVGVLRAAHSTALGTVDAGTTVANGAVLELIGGIAIGSEALTLNGPASGSGALRSLSGTNSFGGVVTLAADSYIGVDADLLTLSNQVTGGFALTKVGAASLTLSGANDYTGLTTVSAGSLRAASNTALGTVANGTTVAGTAILELDGGINIGSEALTLNAVSTTEGTGACLRNVSGTNIVGGTIVISSGTAARWCLIDTVAGTLRVTNTVDDSTVALKMRKIGTGTLRLEGASGSWAGAISLAEGVIQAVGSENALGTTGTCTVSSGAALELEGGIPDTGLAKPLNLSGTGVGGNGVLRSTSGANYVLGAITLAADSMMAVDAGSLQLNGIVSGTGMKLTVKNGDAIPLILNANNTWSGGTDVSSGILRLGSDNRIDNAGTLTLVGANATLDLNGFTETIGSLAGAGVVQWDGTAPLDDLADALTVGGDNASTVFSGRLCTAAGQGDASDSLVKQGMGTLKLTGDNSNFPGVITISAGTLEAAHGNALGSTAVKTTVAAAGTLAMSGGIAIGAEPLDLTGSVALGGIQVKNLSGDNSIGAGAVTLLANGTYVGLGADAGTLTLSGVIDDGGITVNLAKFGSGTVSLEAANTYGGTTTISSGTLNLKGDTGSIATSSAVSVAAGATLSIDGSGNANPDRIANSATVTMNGGTLSLTAGGADRSEAIGTLLLASGANAVALTASGGFNATLIAAAAGTGLSRNSGATLALTRTVAGVTPALFSSFGYDDGCLLPWATCDGSGAMYSTLSGVVPAVTPTSVAYVSAGDGDWGTATTWTPNGIPGASDDVTIVGTHAITLGAPRAVRSLTFSGSGSLAPAGGSLVLRSLVTTGNGTVAVSAPLTSSSGDLPVEVQGSGILTFSGAIGEGLSVCSVGKYGTGTLVLGTASSFSGLFAIEAGLVRIGDPAACGTAGGGVAVASGAALELDAGVAVVGEALSLAGSGPGGLGALRVAADGCSWAGAVTLTADAAIGTLAGDTLTVSGAIGGAFGLNKVGTGTLVLSGNSGYTGATTVTAGTLQLEHNNAVGTSAGGVVVSDGATVALTGTTVIDDTLSIRGTGVGGAGALYTIINQNAWNGAITLQGDTTIGGGGGNIVFGGGISGAYQVTVAIGNGNTCQFSNVASTWSGGTQLQSGRLWLNAADLLPNTGTITMVAGSRLILRNFNETIGNLAGDGLLDMGDVGANTLTLGDASSTVFSGTLATGVTPADATDTIVKAGNGTLTLNGDNSLYTGLISVTGGTLVVGNANALGDAVAGTTASTGTLLISGGLTLAEPLTLAGNGAGSGGALRSSVGANAVTAPITLTAGSTIGVDTGTLTVSQAINGGFALSKAGQGTLVLSAANGYSGTTTVSAGTLRLSGAGTPGDATGGTAVSAGATLELVGPLALGEALSLAGTGVGGAGALRSSAGSTSIGGAVTLTAGSRVQVDAGDLTLSNTVSGGFALTKTGAGNLVLSGGNDYTGATTVSAGVLIGQSVTAFGTTAGGVTVASGAELQLQGGIAVGAESLALAGDGAGGEGALRSTAGANSWAGTCDLPAGASIGVDGGCSLALGGTVTGTDLSKRGAGTLSLSAITDRWTGRTRILGGTLRLAAAHVIPDTSPVEPAAGATFDCNAFDEQIGTLSDAGAVVLGNGSNRLGVLSGSASTFAGGISGGGTAGFDQLGVGNLTLTQASTFAGSTRILQGTLTLASGAVLTCSGVEVAGTLAGAGTASAPVTLAVGGTLSPGTAGPDRLTVGAFTGISGGNVAISLGGTAPATQYDQLRCGGAVDLAGATLNLSVGYAWGIGDSFTILDKTSPGAVTGTFTGLPAATPLQLGTDWFQIAYDGGDGNDVVVTRIAEPPIDIVWTSAGGVDPQPWNLAGIALGSVNSSGTFSLLNQGYPPVVLKLQVIDPPVWRVDTANAVTDHYILQADLDANATWDAYLDTAGNTTLVSPLVKDAGRSFLLRFTAPSAVSTVSQTVTLRVLATRY